MSGDLLGGNFLGGDKAVQTVFLVGCLLLVLTGLSLRRFSLGLLLRSVLSWLVIGAIVYIGVQHRYELSAGLAKIGAKLGLDDQQVQGKTVRIRQSPDGHFWANVRMNGVERRMLIDSGATITALSEDSAKAIGVGKSGGFPVIVDTANGTVTARRGTVKHLTLGPLATRDLEVLVSPAFGDFDVLGMNFLSRLGSWRVEGHTLVLEPEADGAHGKKDRRHDLGTGMGLDPSVRTRDDDGAGGATGSGKTRHRAESRPDFT